MKKKITLVIFALALTACSQPPAPQVTKADTAAVSAAQLSCGDASPCEVIADEAQSPAGLHKRSTIGHAMIGLASAIF
ncbi:MAG: hypothetical protein HUJ24_06565 [Rhodobacteraceae bacterium]|nr:hypothetical protein [Paracoccaceae bacterium]